MKKTIFLVLLIIALFYACSKNSPTSTPNVEQTVAAVLTAEVNANATQTQIAKLYSPTISPTITITPTATASLNMTQTIGAILTAVGAVNATATEQAQETQTAIAGLYTPTLTSTITPSPNQTETAAAIGTIVANIQASETEAVILSRTPTMTLTATATETLTVTVSSTMTETPTITETHTESATDTVTETATETGTATITLTITATAIPYSDLIQVPGGTFNQVDSTGANSFNHTISAFKIGKYQVTYELWYTVCQWAAANGYTFLYKGTEGNLGTAGAAPTAARHQPVVWVSWWDVIVWCNAYSEMLGLTPCYTYSGAVLRNSTNTAACNSAVCAWTNNGYRLLTEGEFQYAASWKGAYSSDGAIEFPTGSGNYWTPYNYASGATADTGDAAATGLVGWYNANCGGNTQETGNKIPNALGAYDMSGNVWSWCWDWYAALPTTAQTDYRGPASGSLRAIRGGGFGNGTISLRVSSRDCPPPSQYHSDYGLRVARTY
jgi:formylglycine-generating enzyme